MPYLTRSCPEPEPMDCRILTAALDLFVEKGFHNVSVHAVRKYADVSIGSLYKHFGGKEGIAEALYTHILSEFDLLIDEIIATNTSPLQQCQAIVRALFSHTETHTNIIAYVFNTKHTEFLSDQPLICNASPFKRMRGIIEQGIKEGEFIPSDPLIVATAIFGGMARMIQMRLDNILEKPLPEYADQYIETIFNGIVLQPSEYSQSHVVIAAKG